MLKGRVGELRWGYRLVGTVGPWVVTSEVSGDTLTAPLASFDSYGITQRPLIFVVPRETGAWRWPVRELSVAGDNLTAQLDAPE